MSKTIDQRVVEMRFDNRHFEQNVKGTMSTLDKLKMKLNFKDSAKGLENINTSANKINMNGLSNALTTVSTKFSALEIMGVTALANITNSAVNAGKRIATALTITPVTTGFQEYETQIKAIQTILANTQKEGTNVEIVNKALDELNEYADRTIYNFTEMTRNIGTFTAAGVKLNDSVAAIKGIANLAAVSGSTSQQASTAMYQLSQALAAGKVQLMDWNSVVNAGMGGQLFQDALIRTSELLGTGAQSAIDMYGSFRESLTKTGWLTTEVLNETLKQIAGTYSESELIAQGFTESQAKEIAQLAKTASDAATEVKTLTQLWDVLKESAQSGWAKSWRIIIGDFEEAKALFSPLSKALTSIIDKMSDARNAILESALGRSFGFLLDDINETVNGVKKVVNTIKDYNKLVDEIIAGQWGNAPTRWQDLTAAGYDWAHAQNLVNERLGFSLRRATAYTETQEELAETQERVNEATLKYIMEMVGLSDSQLKLKGYTDKQIRAFRELEKVAKQTGIPIREFIKNINEIDGRWILMNSLKNVGLSIVTVFKSIGEAWRDAFPPITGDHLFNAIAAFHKLSVVIREKVENNADELTRTLKGLFAIIDIIATFARGALSIAFTILKGVLKAFNMDILDFTALLGDAIVAIRDWIDEHNVLAVAIEYIVKGIKIAISAIKEWAKNNDVIANSFYTIKNGLKGFGNSLYNWLKKLQEVENLPQFLIQGLWNGIKKGIRLVVAIVTELAKTIIETTRSVLGIHSPSTEFFEIGKNIVLGLYNGISSVVKMIYTLLTTVGGKIIDIVEDLDIGSIFTLAVGAGSIYGLVKLANVLDKLTEPLESLDELLENTADAVKAFKGVLNAFKFKIIADSIKSFATAIAILAGSIVVLTMVDPGRMWSAVGAITVLMGLLAGLTVIAGKFGGKTGLEFGKIALTMLGLGMAMMMMASALRTISKIDTGKAIQAIGGFVVIIGSMIGMMAIVGKKGSNFVKLGATFLGLSVAILLMGMVAKSLGKMDRGELIQGTAAIVAFTGIIISLMAATHLLTGSKNVDKIGKSIAKIAAAILIMMVVAKLAAKMEPSELIKGTLAIIAFGGIIVGLMAATKLISGSKNVGKIGSAIFGISAALLMMIFTAKLAATMKIEDLNKGALAISAFSTIIIALMAATNLVTGSKNVGKIGKTILAISVAIGLLAITAAILSLIDIKSLAKGVIAVGFLSAMIAILIHSTKDAKKVTGTLWAIVGAIAVLAIAIGVLSMIKPDKLLSSSVALGIVLGMFSLVLKSSGAVKKGVATIAVLAVGVVALGGVLYHLSQLPADRVIASAIGLSVLLGTMTLVMMALGAMSGMTTQALVGVLGIAGLCITLYLVVDVLSKMQNISNAAENAEALGKFMGILAVVQLLCAAAGAIYTMTGGMAMLGLVGMVALIGTLYLLLGALAIMSNISDAVSNLEALSTFMIKMTGVLIALSIIGPLAMSGVTGMAALIGLMAAIGALAVGIGYLMEKIPAIQKFLDSGIEVLVNLANGVGRIVGAFIGGALSGITNSLPQIGTDLSNFMTNATPFIDGASKITPSMMNGVKSLAETILILTGTDILQSLTSWITGGNSLANFGSQLGGLGTSLNEFASELGEFDESKVTTITCACNAIKTLADASSKIPNDGGLAGFFAGENSIDVFGSKLPGLGTHLNEFVNNLGTFDESKVTTVDCAGKAILALSEAAAEIPSEGGVAGFFAGSNDLGTFGAKLPGLGSQLNEFVTNLGTFSDPQVATVDCAGKAILALSEAASKIPNEGGVAGFFAGNNDMGVFGAKLPELGKHIAEFVGNIGTFSDAQVSAVNSACEAIITIAKLGEIDINSTSSGLNSLGKNMVKFAKKIKDFVNELSKISSDSIASATNKINELIKTLTTISNKSDIVTKFGESLKTIAKDGVKAFVKEFTGSVSKSEAKKALKTLLDAGIDGAEDKKSDVKKKFKSIAEAAVDSLSTNALKKDAEQAGKDLVEGFAKGIRNNKHLATNAGSAIGKAALKAAKEAIDSNSPSKEAMKIGNYFGQGLVIGIDEYASKTYDAAYDIGDRAKDGLSRAISRISNIINSDIETQPMIRPILDLSDVESGAGYLNSMFDNGLSVGVASNLKAISSGVNAKIQNGVNNDVVSAINKLRRDLGNVGGTTNNYNFDGITYDDGSGIQEAVATIVRAAKMERRT